MALRRKKTKKPVGEDPPAFPRGTSVPRHSPLFWVENKDRYLRQLLIRDIESLTKRPLAVYFANRALNSEISIADVERIQEIVTDCPDDFDFLIETGGGETDATESVISCLLHSGKKFRAIVPNRAKSNGTLLCLAATTILMGPSSELGPIEPLVENIPANIILSDDYNADPILKAYATNAMLQTKSVAHRALRANMLPSMDLTSITNIIESLCNTKRFPSHGSVIDLEQAAELGLSVERASHSDEHWSRIWLLYCMYSYDLKRRCIKKVFETKKVSISIVDGDD